MLRIIQNRKPELICNPFLKKDFRSERKNLPKHSPKERMKEKRVWRGGKRESVKAGSRRRERGGSDIPASKEEKLRWEDRF